MLRDPKWQRLRLKIMERDDFQCTFCGDRTTTLNVHHKYYDKGKNPWEYPEESLLTLCEHCHKSETIDLNKYSKAFIDAFKRSPFVSDDLRKLTQGLRELTISPNSNSFCVSRAYAYAFRNLKAQEILLKIVNKALEESDAEKAKYI